jgi:hypothetical protein
MTRTFCALVLLLISAATASAECAWVQWSKTILPSGEDAWSMVAAYTQQEGGKTACEKAATKAKKATPRGSRNGKGNSGQAVPPRHHGPARAEGEMTQERHNPRI